MSVLLLTSSEIKVQLLTLNEQTFISFVEPYTRAFGDDDIAYLCQKARAPFSL